MTDRRHDNYPGFGDENDFLPDQFSSSEQDQRLREQGIEPPPHLTLEEREERQAAKRREARKRKRHRKTANKKNSSSRNPVIL